MSAQRLHDTDKSFHRKFSPLYWIGFPLSVFGAAFSGGAISRQSKTTVDGQHYYDWLVVGVVCLLAGIVLMVMGRVRK